MTLLSRKSVAYGRNTRRSSITTSMPSIGILRSKNNEAGENSWISRRKNGEAQRRSLHVGYRREPTVRQSRAHYGRRQRHRPGGRSPLSGGRRQGCHHRPHRGQAPGGGQDPAGGRPTL